ncbi:MAG: FtsX-like permease family protein, partial [Erysipelotrichaceae bacterium]|nr:FtsX-like permease family protein [Erysipelotrichaceae bacterium]
DNAIDDDHRIKYTDFTGLLMSSVQTIINAVTYVLIAFVSISLVVSSIMIAVITLISVMERTKEIGILRAIGASKHNISSIFTAETFIIGLLSGVIGVGVSWLLIIPINRIIHSLTDIDNINAVLELRSAIVLVIIAVLLTIFAGFIPSKKASRQDPVVALRTE